MLAAENGFVDIVNTLIQQQGINLDAQGKCGQHSWTALHRACRCVRCCAMCCVAWAQVCTQRCTQGGARVTDRRVARVRCNDNAKCRCDAVTAHSAGAMQ